jgi:hypothetical protein
MPLNKSGEKHVMIKHFHVLYSGFTQRHDNISAGMPELLYQIASRLNNNDTLVFNQHWYNSVRETAGLIYRLGYNRETGEYPSISIAGYSFGGSTAVDLCNELNNIANISVQSLVLCDAVKRRSFYPWGWLSALNPYAEFDIPLNVKRFSSFIQNEDWPRGHKVNVNAAFTHWIEGRQVKIPLTHTQMDNSKQFLTRAYEEAERSRL